LNPFKKFIIKFLKRYGAFSIVLILGMTPFVWFTPGYVMYTVDLRLPPNINHWFQYLYMWNETIGVGAESILDPCLVIFQGIPAFFIWLGFPVWKAQMFGYTFWFTITSLSMYFLARKIFPKAAPWGAPLICVSSYLFNLWQEHILTGNKPPLIAAYAILPWLLKLLMEGLNQEESKNKVFLFVQIAIASLLLSSIGNNVSEAYAVALFLLLFSAYALIASKRSGTLKPTAWFIFQSAMLFVIVNAYWIIPQVSEALQVAGNIDHNSMSFMGWLQGTSKYTSFSNVIRFQGNWTWYQGVGEPYNPYAALYLKNWFFIFISWALPIMVVAGALIGRFSFKGFFILTTIVGIWFGMGAHAPQGLAYEWMFENIPFFWIVRSPYYKFMIMTCIGYAIFLGAFIAHLEKRLKNNSQLWLKVTLGVFAFNLVYGNIIVTGRIFTPKEERVVLPPGRVLIPDYVSKAGEWLDSQSDNSRVFAYNEDRFWTTKWGFRGLSPSLINSTMQPIIFRYTSQNILQTQGSPNQALRLVTIVQRGLRTRQLPRADRLLSLLGTRWFLLDKSLEFVQGGSYNSMRKTLNEQPGLEFERQIGNYDFYSSDSPRPLIYTTEKITLLKQPGLKIDAKNLSTLYPEFTGTAEESLIPLSQGDWSSDKTFILVDQNENSSWQQWLKHENIESMVTYNPIKNAQFENTFFSEKPVNEQFVFSTKYMKSSGIQKNLSSAIKKEEKVITFELLEGFYNETDDMEGWKWMSQSGVDAKHIKVVNYSDKVTKSNFAFTTTTYGSERSLYVYLNSELKKVIPLKGNEKKGILIRGLSVKPGENLISFYTPYSAENRKGINVSFGFVSSSIRFGDLIFGGGINVSEKTEKQVQIIPMNSGQQKMYEEGTYNPGLRVNGKSVSLERVMRDQVFTLTANVFLDSGENQFSFDQHKGIDAAIIFKPIEPGNEVTQDTKPVFQRIDPTHYKIKTSVSKPSFLIVSESYHSGWELVSKNEGGSKRVLRHFKANGFANGYFLPKKGDYDLELVFKPQRLLSIGKYVSTWGLIAFFITYIVSRSGGWVKPRNHS
jgi:hypothetical protein